MCIMRGVREMCTLQQLAEVTPEKLRSAVGIDADAIPLDMDMLLKRWKIVAAPTDFSDMEVDDDDAFNFKGSILGTVGAAGRDNGDVIILYSQNSTMSQINYTVAHELGHCCKHSGLLSKGHILTQLKGSLDVEIEKEADKFAMELLMPEAGMRKIFGSCLRKLGITTKEITNDIRKKIICYVAYVCQVPGVHVEERLVTLDLIRCECN